MTTSILTSAKFPNVPVGPSYTDAIGYTLGTAFTVDADLPINGIYIYHPTGTPADSNVKLFGDGVLLLSSYGVTLVAGANYISTGDLVVLHPGVQYRASYGQSAPSEYYASAGLGGTQYGHIILAAQPGVFAETSDGVPSTSSSNFYSIGVYTVPAVEPVLEPATPFLFGEGVYAEGGRYLAQAVLVDTIQILDVGNPVTVGINVTRSLTTVTEPIPGLIQTTTLANAIESRVDSTYSVKVSRGTSISAGQAVRVVSCLAEPELVGKVLLLDKVSQNGLAMIRKAVASDFEVVNQEGKVLS